MGKSSMALSRVYQLLEPGPVVLVATRAAERPNVMTLSWHLMMEFTPPLVGCVLSNRNYSYELLLKSRECTINIPTRQLARAVVGCGNVSGRRRDKFEAFGLTAVPARSVVAPLIAECYANLECRIADTKLVRKYNLFVLEVVQAWIDRSVRRPRTIHHMGYGRFTVAGDILRLPSRMK